VAWQGRATAVPPAAPAGYVFLGTSPITVLSQSSTGSLKVVSHSAGGVAIGMALAHAQNGLNLYELAPRPGVNVYGVYHYVVDQSTGALTPKGGPVGSYLASSLRDDLVAYDGRGINASWGSELYLVDQTGYGVGYHGRLDHLAINAVTGAVTPDGATTFTDTVAALNIALGGRNLDLLLDTPNTDIVVGTVDAATGKLSSLSKGYALTIVGLAPPTPGPFCACRVVARPGTMAFNGLEGAKLPNGRTYGIGTFSISASGANFTGYGVNSAVYGIFGAPIAFAGDRVITSSTNATASSTSIELFTDPASQQVGSRVVDATGGAPTASLTLGDYYYMEMTGALAEFHVLATGADVAPLNPRTVPVGSAVSMTGFLLHPAQTLITSHPAPTVKTGATKVTVKFGFSANEHATFMCKLDGAAFKACRSPSMQSVGIGTHLFKVMATDDVGVTGPFVQFRFDVVHG